jgi:hypothetical protein
MGYKLMIRQFLIKILTKKSEKVGKTTLTDADREASLLVRQTNQAIKTKEKQIELLERINEIEIKTGEQKEPPMDILLREAIPLFIAKLGGEIAAKGSPQIVKEEAAPQIETQGQQIEFSEEQIKAFIAAQPNIKKLAVALTDAQIKDRVRGRMPNITEESLNKIILEVRK